MTDRPSRDLPAPPVHRRWRRRAVIAATGPALVLTIATLPLMNASASVVPPTTGTSARALPVASTAGYTISSTPLWTPQVFGPTSAFRRNVVSAPVNVNSKVMVTDLAGQVSRLYGGTAAFNVWKYGVNIVKVPKSQARSTVKFDDCQHKGYTPSGLYNGSKQFVGVPIPSNAIPAAGSDGGLTIWSPDTDQLWDFWKANKKSDGWHACWGGRIDHLWSSPGFFPSGFGASASGLAGGGAIRIDEVRNGRIPHAISLGVINYASWKNVSWPAQRSDGSSSSTSKIMIGSRFRLPASVDVNKLGLTPIGKLVAVAAQQYGFIVTDKSGGVAVPTESGAQVQARTGKNPWVDLMGGTPSYAIMQHFPWNKLQALPKDYGKP